MHVLVISRPPDFTPDGEIIPGQCDPTTDGWRLRLVEDGVEEVLLEGTYLQLRRVQGRSAGKPVEEARRLAAEAALEMADAASRTAEVGEGTEILGVGEVHRAMFEFELAASLGEGAAELDWIGFSERGRISVASFKAGEPGATAERVGLVLKAALDSAPAGLVVDLSNLKPDGTETARAVAGLVERARAAERFLGFVGASDEIGRALSEAAGGAGCVFADVDAAIAAAPAVPAPRPQSKGADVSEATGDTTAASDGKSAGESTDEAPDPAEETADAAPVADATVADATGSDERPAADDAAGGDATAE